MGSEYDSHRLVLSSYPGSVTFFLSFFFIISFFANELFMKSIYRSVACNELIHTYGDTDLPKYIRTTVDTSSGNPLLVYLH